MGHCGGERGVRNSLLFVLSAQMSERAPIRAFRLMAAFVAGLMSGLSPALFGGGDFWLCYLPPAFSFVLGFFFGRWFWLCLLGIYLGLLINASIPSKEQIIRLDSWKMLTFFLIFVAALTCFSLATGLLGWAARWALRQMFATEKDTKHVGLRRDE